MRTPKDGGQPCSYPACVPYSRTQQGTVRAIATSRTQSGRRRLLCCPTWATHFAATRETIFFDRRPSAEQVMMALKMLLVRVALADISFERGVTEAPVRA
jgi:hypothetical protein